MDLIDQLRALGGRIQATKDMIQTEEATKNAMIMPFIHALGYNVFDPNEVTPELVADIGMKKGEKVDYAILREGKPIMLFECKRSGGDLSVDHAGQLFRYFHVTSARFGVLTNGLVYRFFTDLEEPNKMDRTPFFEFNILDFKDRDIDELKKFAKTAFDVDTILTTANELKYTRAIQNKLSDWIMNPSEDFVRLVSSEICGSKRFTSALKDQFTAITKRAFDQLVSERINDRLKGAMALEPSTSMPAQLVEPASDPTESQIITTPEEVEGFHIVRAILRETVSPKRVHMRDAQSYCAILLDDNNRKPICRLRFNNAEKLCLGVFNAEKEEERIPLSSVDDIYDHAELLKASVGVHLQQSERSPA
ncbi:type I restriction endonuclease [Massilia cavernae]|uniref:Restriction endonuclease n=1 Tax=Massilia cavernae TaxID=2320864 RepID=A0A418XRI2_9BURK|nr:type I restriction endonuclease [Massilia cavernae]RJG15138.1 restriction endonuclease [Massilia cavernae]